MDTKNQPNGQYPQFLNQPYKFDSRNLYQNIERTRIFYLQIKILLDKYYYICAKNLKKIQKEKIYKNVICIIYLKPLK